jgi:hypothetical protein
MIDIHIQAADATSARMQMIELLGVRITAAAPLPSVPLPAPATNETAGTEQPKEAQSGKPVSGRTREKSKAKAEAETRAISTGEERVDPAVEAQDKADEKADEKADTEASKPAEKVTHDDVRAALGDYVKKFGMPAAQEDGPKVLVLVLGEGKSKVSDIPDDQELLAKCINGVKELLEKNPFNREPVKAAA